MTSLDNVLPLRHARTRPPKAADSGEVNSGQLRAFVARIERLSDEKSELAKDIAEIYAEARGTGFDAKALRNVVKIRAQDPAVRAELETISDIYLAALAETN